MALTRAMLEGMGLTEAQVGAIIGEHTTVTGELVAERDNLKEQVKELSDVQKQLDDLKKEYDEFKENVEKDDWQEKYETEHKDFEAFKAEIESKESATKIREAYKKLLTECKVGDKHIDSILKITDYSNMKLQEDGTFEDADKLKENITTDWSGFITTTGSKGTEPATPPDNNSGGGDGGESRAAQLAAKYRENLYGKAKED